VTSEARDVKVRAVLDQALARLDPWLLQHGRSVEAQPGSRHALDDEAAFPFPISHACQHALAHALDHLQTLRSVVVKAGDLPMSVKYRV